MSDGTEAQTEARRLEGELRARKMELAAAKATLRDTNPYLEGLERIKLLARMAREEGIDTMRLGGDETKCPHPEKCGFTDAFVAACFTCRGGFLGGMDWVTFLARHEGKTLEELQ